MNKAVVVYHPIGVIHSEHIIAQETPIQPVYAKGCQGWAEIDPAFMEGFVDLDGFSHIYLIYHFHQVDRVKRKVKPFLQDIEHGLFATRSPFRPNAIGLSVVELIRLDGNRLYFDGADILDGTPLLDIKPYTAKFDRFETSRNGWQDEVDEQTAQQRGLRDYKK